MPIRVQQNRGTHIRAACESSNSIISCMGQTLIGYDIASSLQQWLFWTAKHCQETQMPELEGQKLHRRANDSLRCPLIAQIVLAWLTRQ